MAAASARFTGIQQALKSRPWIGLLLRSPRDLRSHALRHDVQKTGVVLATDDKRIILLRLTHPKLRQTFCEVVHERMILHLYFDARFDGLRPKMRNGVQVLVK